MYMTELCIKRSAGQEHKAENDEEWRSNPLFTFWPIRLRRKKTKVEDKVMKTSSNSELL